MKEIRLRLLFSTFPGGGRGIGLLLLRCAVGTAAMIKGGGYLSGPASIEAAIAGVMSLAVGFALLVGFITPIASGLTTLGALAGCVSRLAATGLESTASFAFVGIVAASLTLLGPGALSLDSRLFGRREIIIPPSPRFQQP
jgi:hypothetical protein